MTAISAQPTLPLVRHDGGPEASIRTQDLTESFGGQVALQSVDLELPRAGSLVSSVPMEPARARVEGT